MHRYTHAISYRVHLYLYKLLQPSKHFFITYLHLLKMYIYIYTHAVVYGLIVATVNFSDGSRDFIGGGAQSDIRNYIEVIFSRKCFKSGMVENTVKLVVIVQSTISMMRIAMLEAMQMLEGLGA